MAYRVNVQFKDGSTNGPKAEVVDATLPRCGETIVVSRHGRPISLRVTAIWTPSSKVSKVDALVVVEALEI